MNDLLFLFYFTAIFSLISIIREKMHFASIRKREFVLSNVEISNKKKCPYKDIRKTELATASIVMVDDFFKDFIAGFVNFFGGELSVYSSLLDRARREAILRIVEAHPNAKAFYNLKLDSAQLGDGKIRKRVEISATATAIY